MCKLLELFLTTQLLFAGLKILFLLDTPAPRKHVSWECLLHLYGHVGIEVPLKLSTLFPCMVLP